MRRTYGSLSIEVPEDFDDETIIILRAPPVPSATPLRVPRGESSRPTFVVKRVQLRADPLPLEALAKAEAEMLAAAIPDITISKHERREIDGREVILFELAFNGPEGPMRQAHASLVEGAWFVGFAATAPDDVAFTSIRERLLELVATVEVG